MENGELVSRAEGEFDVPVTADRGLRHQQNLAGLRLGIIVLPGNRVPEVLRLLPELERALDVIQPGTLVELATPG